MELVLTKRLMSSDSPVFIDDYIKTDGYLALSKALKESSSEIIIDIIDKSKLRGRGGAGFLTNIKWKALPPIETSSRPRYLACNFDEMEPGTFKDRVLIEGDPHQFIEGLIITAFACKLDIGYVFVRGEYYKAAQIIKQAIGEAYAAGYLGKNILGSGWGFDLYIHTSAGRYICGEETALLNSLEGKRANPRSKPPYPQSSGLWGKPTIVQNVETLSNIPHIVLKGADWFIGLSKCSDSGTKLYGASGKINNPGIWELPMGTTIREILDDYAKGMKEGYSFRAALPGGSSTKFLDSSQLDLPLSFDTLKANNLFFGTGEIIVLDDKTCPVALAHNLMKFYARESCGWCTPCREGIPWINDLLYEIENGRGESEDLELIRSQASYIGPNSFCAFAMGAMLPLQSAMEHFREDFEAHINDKKCPY